MATNGNEDPPPPDDVADSIAAQRARQRGTRSVETNPEPNTTIDVFGDGSIRFVPPFSKEEAEYLRPTDPGFDETHDRCGDCVHFIPDEGCHFVQGKIKPAAYCEEYYADYGAFAHKHEGHVEVNAELVGREMHFDERDIRDFVDELEERLQQRNRERPPEQERNP